MTERGTTESGVDYVLARGEIPAGQRYPATDTYQFGEFAGPVAERPAVEGVQGRQPGPVAEFDGYGGITLTDPWTGDRLWVGDVAGEFDGSLWDAMRRIIGVAEDIGFMAESPAA